MQWLGELWRKYHQVFVLLDEKRLNDVERDYGPGLQPVRGPPARRRRPGDCCSSVPKLTRAGRRGRHRPADRRRGAPPAPSPAGPPGQREYRAVAPIAAAGPARAAAHRDPARGGRPRLLPAAAAAAARRVSEDAESFEDAAVERAAARRAPARPAAPTSAACRPARRSGRDRRRRGRWQGPRARRTTRCAPAGRQRRWHARPRLRRDPPRAGLRSGAGGRAARRPSETRSWPDGAKRRVGRTTDPRIAWLAAAARRTWRATATRRSSSSPTARRSRRSARR